jgi:hypothetical protein
VRLEWGPGSPTQAGTDPHRAPFPDVQFFSSTLGEAPLDSCSVLGQDDQASQAQVFAPILDVDLLWEASLWRMPGLFFCRFFLNMHFLSFLQLSSLKMQQSLAFVEYLLWANYYAKCFFSTFSLTLHSTFLI